MSLRSKVLSGSGILMGGQLLGQALSFVRNIILARMLTEEDYGIASTFLVAVTLLESISDLSVDRLLVQAEEGGEPEFQANAHLFQVIRGFTTAFVMFFLASPFSYWFGIPEALWALQSVALIPLIRGFAHLDPKRLHRHLNFGFDVKADLIPQAILVVLAWPLSNWLQDYSAMLWLLVIQAAAMTLVTQLFSERRYAWSYDRHLMRRMVTFGWPLLLNGFLVFLAFQGDRFVIGRNYGMASLGIYTVGFTLVWQPMAILIKCSTLIILPILSRVRKHIALLEQYFMISVAMTCVVGVVSSALFILLGKDIVVVVYGEKYSGAGSFIGWIGVMLSLRIVRTCPTVACLAFGDTVGPLLSNIGRVSVFPVLLFVASRGMDLADLAIVNCFGEGIALAVVIFRLHCVNGLSGWLSVKPLALAMICIGFAAACASVLRGAPVVYAVAAVVLVSGLNLITMVVVFPHVRDTVTSLVWSSPKPAVGD